ncbi:uncharacterized protein PGTG_05014 [Puccinia graminis f. sp. tritici CRL 75-36-700-3]|uniref:Tyr recombinase domain-containing protein n=1 Tax=Puccinia graminis f. sp. tritici (strain CRL 75-36-700-3 / race SCCL) TaxID=418459 RepID=E3K3K1_PUCGT|nr:uncharacterized protein PGTG_05014 [Puccinia graminis f. sp. tritici CRL 75-36-700-3]EFP79058.2 hypothetical protein PGTG_05014 [Puccinia graminis f. sp. tritici CRL 75-36-700-3]
MTNPIQAISNAVKGASSQDPNTSAPPTGQTPSQSSPTIPPENPPHGPKRPANPSGTTSSSKTNTTQKSAEGHKQTQPIPAQSIAKQGLQPKGKSLGTQATKTAAALGVENAGSASSQDVAANTLRKYLAGIQMWHTYHNAIFPEQTKLKVSVMLKSSAYVDVEVPKKPRKKAVTIDILVKLAEILATGDPFQRALFDLSVVAFWGMARLVELTYNDNCGPLRPQASLLTSDIRQDLEGGDGSITLVIRGAKTASPGEEQLIRLKRLPHMLCPVLAVHRRLSEASRYHDLGGANSLFGFLGPDGNRHHITKPMATRALDKIWKACGYEGVSGHSFRVGGASLQRALGIPVEQICTRGRWASDCYKLYLRHFLADELAANLALLNQLEEAWDS